MAYTDETWLDPSKRASLYLDKVLNGVDELENGEVPRGGGQKQNKEGEQPGLPEEETTTGIDVRDARRERSVLDQQNERNLPRLLIITKNTAILDPASSVYKHIVDEGHFFEEIHIIVLTVSRRKRYQSVRPQKNIWVYSTNSTSFFRLCIDGYRAACAQLLFGKEFRADLIVAEDAHESGAIAWYLGRKFLRPIQLHISENIFDRTTNHNKLSFLYTRLAHFLLKRIQSIRTTTDLIRHALIAQYPNREKTTLLLPNYYMLHAWEDALPSFDIHETYPQFKFILLHVSGMHKASHTKTVIDGALPLLRRYPTIGLLILGDGPQRLMHERHVIALGIQRQVEFQPLPEDLISYMKTANVYLHHSVSAGEDEYLLMAATTRVPIVSNVNCIAGKLFKEGESAHLCALDDVSCVTRGINAYLNNNMERTRFTLAAHEAVLERVDQDYTSYIRHYTESIKYCMIEAPPLP